MMQRTAGAGYAAALTLAVGAWASGPLLGGRALAQIDTGSKSPIDVTAERSEVFNARCLAILTGDAEAVQDQNRLRADTLTIHSRPKGAGADGKTACGGVSQIEAEGHVYYVTPDQNVRGDHALYDQDDDRIVLTGDVVVVQGQDVARGDKLTIKVSTHQATLESKTTGAGRPGRVRGVFYPDQTRQAARPAAPAKP
jgi:lipopolysaccharide export system protein LptA